MKPIRITAKSKDHARAIWAALESQGFKNAIGCSFDEHEAEFPWYKGKDYGLTTHGSLISWDWAEPNYASIDEAILSLPKTRTLKLNDEYTAIITAEDVKVGCQTFNHDIIHELARLCREVRMT